MTTTKKIAKRDIDNIREFAQSGYIKTASEWTTGSGRYTKRRSTPIFTKEYTRMDFMLVEEGYTKLWKLTYQERMAYDYLKNHPRVQRVLVMDFEKVLSALHGVEVEC
jgi:hypothetical protein